MIRYLNRQGEQIDKVDWLLLSRDPDYVCVESSRTVDFWVKTDWLGVNAECEPSPRIFITRALAITPQGNPIKEIVIPRWTDTEEEAVQAHKSLCEDLFFA